MNFETRLNIKIQRSKIHVYLREQQLVTNMGKWIYHTKLTCLSWQVWQRRRGYNDVNSSNFHTFCSIWERNYFLPSCWFGKQQLHRFEYWREILNCNVRWGYECITFWIGGISYNLNRSLHCVQWQFFGRFKPLLS